VSAAVADADRVPSWYRSSEPYVPGSLSSLSRSFYYFSPIYHFASTTSNWIATHSASSAGADPAASPAAASPAAAAAVAAADHGDRHRTVTAVNPGTGTPSHSDGPRRRPSPHSPPDPCAGRPAMGGPAGCSASAVGTVQVIDLIDDDARTITVVSIRTSGTQPDLRRQPPASSKAALPVADPAARRGRMSFLAGYGPAGCGEPQGVRLEAGEPVAWSPREVMTAVRCCARGR